MGQLGIGVMLNMLGGNNETLAAIKASLNKKISAVHLDGEGNELKISLVDGTTLVIWDNGQSCCENRYMNTSDNLSEHAGETLIDFELKDAPNAEGQYGDEHEIQFLDVITDKGRFQIANHNEHNGYYGGFSIAAKLVTHE